MERTRLINTIDTCKKSLASLDAPAETGADVTVKQMVNHRVYRDKVRNCAEILIKKAKGSFRGDRTVMKEADELEFLLNGGPNPLIN